MYFVWAWKDSSIVLGWILYANYGLKKNCMYEWKHRGYAHIHGFLWLPGSSNMETLDWTNRLDVDEAKYYFEKYATMWNPHDIHCRNVMVLQSVNDDPCVLKILQIFLCNPNEDYEHLVN